MPVIRVPLPLAAPVAPPADGASTGSATASASGSLSDRLVLLVLVLLLTGRPGYRSDQLEVWDTVALSLRLCQWYLYILSQKQKQLEGKCQ